MDFVIILIWTLLNNCVNVCINSAYVKQKISDPVYIFLIIKDKVKRTLIV